jgi:lysophospholipid acyltransferase (LPLAT)-like uncharacterized protein
VSGLEREGGESGGGERAGAEGRGPRRGRAGSGEAEAPLKYRAAGLAGAGVLGLLGLTLRFRVEGDEHIQECRRKGQAYILAFWHAWILPMAYLHRRQGIVVLVSDHRDGEYISRVIGRMGFGTARGSSTRGGAKGLMGSVRALRAGTSLGLTPDGPRGPARVFKPGGLVAAQISGAPIIPMAVRGGPVKRLPSWDRFVLPYPFARVHLRYGAPHFVPREATQAELEVHARTLEAEMNALEAPS